MLSIIEKERTLKMSKKTCGNCEMEKPIQEFQSNATKLKNRNQTVTLNCADCREELNQKNHKYKTSSEEDSSSDDGSEDDSCVVDDDTISYEDGSDSDEDDDEEEDEEDKSEDYDRERDNKKRRRMMVIESDDEEEDEEEEEESSDELIPEIFKTKKWQFKSMRLPPVEFMELILENQTSWIYNKKANEAIYKKNQDYKVFYTQ